MCKTDVGCLSCHAGRRRGSERLRGGGHCCAWVLRHKGEMLPFCFLFGGVCLGANWLGPQSPTAILRALFPS